MECKNPLVSILVPTYNRAQMVGKAIESALSQTCSDIEVIVCDNCSTDKTVEVVQAYAGKDRRLRLVVNETNVGPTRNWKRCVEEARGKYAKLLFSDDWMDPEYLEKTLPMLEENEEVGFGYTSTVVHDLLSESTEHFVSIESSGIYPINLFTHYHLYNEGLTMPSSPSCALFRKIDLRQSLVVNIPNKLGIDPSKNGAGVDLLVFLNTALRYDFFGFINEPLSHFGKHKTCFTFNEGDLWLFHRLAVCRYVHRAGLSSDLRRKFFTKLGWELYKRGRLSDLKDLLGRRFRIRDLHLVWLGSKIPGFLNKKLLRANSPKF